MFPRCGAALTSPEGEDKTNPVRTDTMLTDAPDNLLRMLSAIFVHIVPMASSVAAPSRDFNRDPQGLPC